jgi:hypothetical protein
VVCEAAERVCGVMCAAGRGRGGGAHHRREQRSQGATKQGGQ